MLFRMHSASCRRGPKLLAICEGTRQESIDFAVFDDSAVAGALAGSSISDSPLVTAPAVLGRTVEAAAPALDAGVGVALEPPASAIA